MTGNTSPITNLDKRIAALQALEVDQKDGLRNTANSIGASFAPLNMIKMAIGSKSRPGVSGTVLAESVVFAGTAIAEKYFGKEKFHKIQKITAPFVRIALSKLIRIKRTATAN